MGDARIEAHDRSVESVQYEHLRSTAAIENRQIPGL
jgi:hypothetical protein